MKNLVTFLSFVAVLLSIIASCEPQSSLPPHSLQQPRIVSTSVVSQAYGATLIAEVENASQITECGFYIVEASSKRREDGELNDGKIICQIDGLTPVSDYQYQAYIGNGQIEILSETGSFTTLKPDMPSVKSISVEPGIHEAHIQVFFSDISQITSCSVILSDSDISSEAEKVSDHFECNLTGLKDETDYTYSVSYSTLYDSSRSEPMSFTTKPTPFSIEISSQAEPALTSVKLSASISANKAIDECGFIVWEDGVSSPMVFKCTPEDSFIEKEITDLKYNTGYTYCIYYIRGEDSSESVRQSFHTLSLPMPTLSDLDIIVDMEEATLFAIITGTEHLAKCGFILEDKANNNKQIVEVIPENGVLTYSWEGLEPRSDYSFCAFCENGYETGESTPITFTTRSQPFDPSLLEYLIANFDTNQDGKMSKNELESIKEIVLSDILLESQSGLESMPNLISLSMGDNWLKRIDLSVCPKLEFFSGGRSPHLEELYLDNPCLWQLNIIEVNNLKTIDTSKCPELSSCFLWFASVEYLDFSSNTKLESLGISYTKLTELDLSNNWKLKALFAAESNDELRTIWLKEGIVMNACEVGTNTQILYK